MDYKELTSVFWDNVDRVRKKRGLTWGDLSERTGHSAGSISTMKTMNKMPSLGFSRSIASALDESIENLCTRQPDTSSEKATIQDVLAVLAKKMRPEDVYTLIMFAETFIENNSHLRGGVISNEDGESSIGEITKRLIEKYL